MTYLPDRDTVLRYCRSHSLHPDAAGLVEAERHAAEVTLTSTAKLEPVYRQHGFRPVWGPDEVRLNCPGGPAFLPTWLIRWHGEPTRSCFAPSSDPLSAAIGSEG